MYKIATTDKQRKAATKMAVYFSQHLNAESLLLWASYALQYDRDRKLNCFLSHLTGEYLPGLLYCKDKRQARAYNEDALPLLFDSMLYDNMKEGINTMCNYFKWFLANNMMLADEVTNFWKLTAHIETLNETYLAIEQNRKAA